MRLAHVMSPGPMAGAEAVVIGGGASLIDAGHALRIFVLSEDRAPTLARRFADAASAKGVPTEIVPVRGRVDLPAVQALRAALCRYGPSIVHAHGYKAVCYCLGARSKSAALVATHHGDTSHTLQVRMYEWLTRLAYRRLDGVFCVSEAMATELKRHGIPGRLLRCVPNPVWLPEASAVADGSSWLSSSPLLFVGRLSPEKGLDTLLQAMSSPSVPPSLCLMVAGDGPCREAWQNTARSLGIEHRVSWLGMRRDVPDLLRRADALVLPSRREGMPLVIVEALACGVPTIASRVGGIPEVVSEGRNGWLLPPDDPLAWATALAAWPQGRLVLRAGAVAEAADVRERHRPARWAQTTATHYVQLAAARR